MAKDPIRESENLKNKNKDGMVVAAEAVGGAKQQCK